MMVIALETNEKHGKVVIVLDCNPAVPETFTLPFPLSAKHVEFAKWASRNEIRASSSFDFPEEEGFTRKEADDILKLFGFVVDNTRIAGVF